ncbi:MAG: DUF4391 domain-containing protein [Methanobrevibacter sp.]|jgi:hypothetical protein|nr:DUF4391 domain-containing protein [Candidatus Methanoflexus mossambicus]
MEIKEIFNVPDSCSVGTFIPKKQFYEFQELNNRDRNIFIELIEKINWLYTLKEKNIRISPYTNKNRDYCEVEIIQIMLKENKNITNKKIERIADIILRGILYPLVLIFQINKNNETNIKIAVSHIKNHLSDSSKITLDGIIFTNWIDLENLDEIDLNLFNSLNIENLSFSHFYKFYSDIVDNIIIYNASKNLEKQLDVHLKDSKEVKDIYDEINDLNREIKLKKNQITNETQFNRQVEINIEINDLKNEIKSLKVKLSE